MKRNAAVLPGLRIRPTRAEVDLAAIVDNARELSKVAPLFAVVKADAYGYGAVPVSRALADSGAISALAVSLVEEGVELREAGIDAPILVMGPAMLGAGETIVNYRLMPLISDRDALAEVLRAAESLEMDVAVHLKLDTGMGRLGLHLRDLDDATSAIDSCSRSKLVGVASHLACADDDAPIEACMTATQLERFREWTASLDPMIQLHIANSAGALRFSDVGLGAIRAGLALYGSGAATNNPQFRSSMRFVSAVSQLRELPAGGTVGYGASWRAETDSRLAIVAVGYADGYPRSLSDRAEVLVRGRRAPLVGAVSMDISVVDVSDFDNIAVGDEVVLLGAQGAEEITVAEFAARSLRTEYEVTCGISKRVPRDYR